MITLHDVTAYNIDERKLSHGKVMDCTPRYFIMPGNIKTYDKSKYHGGFGDDAGLKAQKHNDGSLGLYSYTKGHLTITKDGLIYPTDNFSQFCIINKSLKPKISEPSKVYFPLNKLKPATPLRQCEDGYAHFSRMLAWLQYSKKEFANFDEKEKKFKYNLPDFIAPKEVFTDMYVTPYRRNLRQWKMKAVTYDDGRVYIQSDRTLAVKPPKISFETAFNAFLQGRAHSEKEGCSFSKEIIEYIGDYWTVRWGEVDGLGLCYSSKTDVMDQWAYPDTKPVGTSSRGAEYNKVQKSHMFKTHLCQAPVNTKEWREYLWNEMLGWWADYQFGGDTRIICGELEGSVVTALRLFSSAKLPDLAKACCHKEPWDPTVCEKYMASLLRFIKMCCGKAPRGVLSFELKENGDVVCINEELDKAKRMGYDRYQILPQRYINDFYPPPPPPPKPGKRRGRKPKVKPETKKKIPKFRRRSGRARVPYFSWVQFNKHGQKQRRVEKYHPLLETAIERSPPTDRTYKLPFAEHLKTLTDEMVDF